MRSFLDGGPFVWLLLGLSVTALTVVLERLWSLRRDRILPRPLMDALADGDVARLRGACQAQPSPMARLILSILDHLPWPKAENVAALEVRARQEIASLERGLVILEIIVGIAPLLGLVGTIYGIIPLLGILGATFRQTTRSLPKGCRSPSTRRCSDCWWPCLRWPPGAYSISASNCWGSSWRVFVMP